MFHTIKLFRKINYSEYYHLDISLKSLSKKLGTRYFAGKDKEWIYNCFTNKGITIVLRETNLEDNIKYRQIEIRFTPKRLLVEKEFIEVVNEEDLDTIRKKFKKVISVLKKEFKLVSKDKYGPKFIFDNLEKYSVKRIDYCVNIFNENSKEYLSLIRRADIPISFKPYEKYNPKRKRKEMPKGSFYLISNSVVINIYNKYEQMIGDEYYKDLDISNSKDILRVEIQCKLQKVNNLKNKYKIKDKTIFSFACNEISRDTILHYLERTVGLGDYFTLDIARDRINKRSELRENTKKEMIEIMELISETRSIPMARQKYSDKEDKFNKVLKKINEMGINPVTIPIKWGLEHLPNPIQEINRRFILYRKQNK